MDLCQFLYNAANVLLLPRKKLHSAMSANLEQQYDQVIDYIDGFSQYVARIGQRGVRAMYGSLRDVIRIPGMLRRMRRELNPISGRTPEWARTFISDHATEDEAQSEYFGVATSVYWTHTLSINLINRYPGFDFSRLKELHALKWVGLSRNTGKPPVGRYVGFVLAAAAFLLDRVPKSVVEGLPLLDLTYQQYKIVVFLVTAGAIIYLLLLLIALSWVGSKYDRAKRTHESAETILGYAELKYRETE
jgi:hypothetical protein